MRNLFALVLFVIPTERIVADETLESCAYFPLKVGNAWQYKLTGSFNISVVKTVTKNDKLNGKLCAFTEIKAVDGRKLFSSWEREYSIDKDGVYFDAILGDLYSPAVRFLKLPLKAEETWSASTKVKKLEYRYEFTCGKEEEITVPAGKFKAIPVKSTDWWVGDKEDKIERVEWFAKDVGLVKGYQKVDKKSDTIELEKFTPAK